VTGPELERTVGDFGTTVTRSVVRDGVRMEIKYFYEASDMDAIPKVVTVIPKVLKK
jgi:hypothetical protein